MPRTGRHRSRDRRHRGGHDRRAHEMRGGVFGQPQQLEPTEPDDDLLDEQLDELEEDFAGTAPMTPAPTPFKWGGDGNSASSSGRSAAPRPSSAKPSMAPHVAGDAPGAPALPPPGRWAPLGPPPGPPPGPPHLPPQFQMTAVGYPFMSHPLYSQAPAPARREDEKESLVRRVKRMQGDYGNNVCDVWNKMCDRVGKKRNPALHDTKLLSSFLEKAKGIVNQVDALVRKVKDASRKAGVKAQWEELCDKHGDRMRDPKRQPPDFLQRFLDAIQNGTDPKDFEIGTRAATKVYAECRRVQEASPGHKAAWHEYCDSEGQGQRNPKSHSAAFVQVYLDRMAAAPPQPRAAGAHGREEPSGTTEQQRLVTEVRKKLDASARTMRDWYDFCEAEGGGERNIRKQTEEVLQAFLACFEDGAFGEIIRDAEHERLVNEVRAKKEADPIIQKRWAEFINVNGLGVMNPARHESDLLDIFLAQAELWAAGDETEVQEEDGLLGPRPGGGRGGGRDVPQATEPLLPSGQVLPEDADGQDQKRRHRRRGGKKAARRRAGRSEGEGEGEGEDESDSDAVFDGEDELGAALQLQAAAATADGAAPQKKGDTIKCYVGGLPDEAVDADLEEHFSMFGLIVEAKVMVSRRSVVRSRNYGFVTLSSTDGSHRDVLKCEHQILGKDVECREYDGNSKNDGNSKEQTPTVSGSGVQARAAEARKPNGMARGGRPPRQGGNGNSGNNGGGQKRQVFTAFQGAGASAKRQRRR